jgi:hypothetical protein
MAERDSTRDELKAAVSARRDLGPDYEDSVVDSFVERIDSTIAARVDARVEERTKALRAPIDKESSDRAFVLGIISLGTGIPISGIAAGVPEGGAASVAGLVVAWVGIVGVNVAHALASRRR